MAFDLALFDLDHTLLPIDSDHAFGEFLIAQGLVAAEHFRATNDQFYADYQAGTLDIGRFVEFTLAPLRHLSRSEREALHRQYMDQVITPAILPAAQELVQIHLDRGDLCAIVTGTNSFVTAPIARAFGVPHLIATVAALNGEHLNGQLRGTPAYREGKVVRVTAWLESMALCLASFERSTFYSDSHNDLPLLLQVTDPVATNPDPTLRATALTRGWRILDLFPRA